MHVVSRLLQRLINILITF